MKQAVLITIFTMVFLTGCNMQRSFQPPRYSYELYWKQGATESEVQKALLECGLEDLFGGLKFDKSYKEHFETEARAELCMLRDGYLFAPDYRGLCRDIPNLESCKQENAYLIPSRDIKRRLSSPYCKAYPKTSACVP